MVGLTLINTFIATDTKLEECISNFNASTIAKILIRIAIELTEDCDIERSFEHLYEILIKCWMICFWLHTVSNGQIGVAIQRRKSKPILNIAFYQSAVGISLALLKIHLISMKLSKLLVKNKWFTGKAMHYSMKIYKASNDDHLFYMHQEKFFCYIFYFSYFSFIKSLQWWHSSRVYKMLKFTQKKPYNFIVCDFCCISFFLSSTLYAIVLWCGGLHFDSFHKRTN